MESNRALVIGKVVTPFIYSHELFGEKFYSFKVASTRDSGVDDIIPCLVSERLLNVNEDLTNRQVRIEGNFRSKNIHIGNKSKLSLNLFIKEFEVVEDYVELLHVDTIKLVGFICKEPVFRYTPKGRMICEFLMAVNYENGKSAYIPCIAWGRNARYVERLTVGTKLEVLGRIQSREYEKKYENGKTEIKTTYEVSVQLIED
jgi:primosomal replication protein N